MARNLKQIVADTDDRWGRFWDALLGQPRTINTEPPVYPEWADRKDRLDHAWINLWTEGIRDTLGRDPGDELSQLLGQITGITVPLVFIGGLVWSIFSG